MTLDLEVPMAQTVLKAQEETQETMVVKVNPALKVRLENGVLQDLQAHLGRRVQ